MFPDVATVLECDVNGKRSDLSSGNCVLAVHDGLVVGFGISKNLSIKG